MKKEDVAVTAAVAGVAVAFLSWLMPFRPVGDSPAVLLSAAAPRREEPVRQPAPAPPERSADTRNRWAHSNGAFVAAGNGRWNELGGDGKVYFRFREHDRDDDAVVIHDESRDCYVRLSDSLCEVKCMWWQGNDLRWQAYYRGSWQ